VVAQRARQKGVAIYPLECGAASLVTQKHQRERMIMLGYSSLPESLIRRGIALVAQAIRET